ncbi:MAG: protein-disulfide reductase DsbD family protein [Acidobacteriota bacterium]|nr:protein-disulfide reductase DsbD N-terminal domain-containing protein [Blastocatellia bacterium]MDW8413566.1 protein-disulfide reductase DsbD family protein [Acidobacteriota bacterium]
MLALLLLGWVAAIATVQDPAKAVTAKVYASTDKVVRGGSFEVAVVLDIDPKFHINSAKPLDENLIPTKVELLETSGFKFSPPSYPKGTLQKFSFSDQSLSVYHGRVIIRLSGNAAKNVELGQKKLKLQLAYQACNDQACFAPKKVELPLEIEVVAPGTKISPINQEFFPRRGR